MKLSVFGFGVAFALASLTSPLTAADARQSGGFSSSRSDTTTTKSDTGSGRRDSVQPRSNGGFTATPRAAPEESKSAAPVAQQPRTNSGFSSNRAANPPAATGSQRSANGFGAGAGIAAQKPSPSAVDRIAARSQSQAAFKRFKQDQAVYKAPPVAEPVNRAAAQNSAGWRQYGSGWHNPDEYYRSRSSAFDRHPEFRVYYEQPRPWVSRPSYGWIAAGFLGGALLDHYMEPGYANWAYSHRTDPAYEAWHQDMMAQAAENQELRDKMAALDAQVADLQAKNAPTTDALPPGVDPSLVVAPSTALIATTDESSGFPWIKTILFSILGTICFLGLCIFISQRNRHRIA